MTSLLEEENQQLKKMLHRIDAEKSAAIIHSAQMAERVDELEGVIRQEAEYCFGYHEKLKDSDPDRAARHKARGDRLMTAIQG